MVSTVFINNIAQVPCKIRTLTSVLAETNLRTVCTILDEDAVNIISIKQDIFFLR